MGRAKIIADDAALAIARDLFASEGHSVSTRRLAAATGLSQATLIQRFGNKDQMFAAAMLPPPLNMQAVADAAGETGLPDLAVALVREVAERLPIVLQVAANPAIGKTFLQSAHARLQVPGAIAALTSRVDALQRQGKVCSNAEPQAIVEALLVAAHGFTLMMLTSADKKLPVEAIRRFATTLSNI